MVGPAMEPRSKTQDCKPTPGTHRPVVDRARCEGKKDCVEVCPYGVFEVRRIDEAEYRALPFLARLKLRLHGLQTSYTPGAADCHACGLCVTACPEKAIKLQAL
jgi:4Fe-4S ferredoxin